MRIFSFMHGNWETMHEFGLVSHQDARMILSKFIKNDELKEQIIELIPDKSISRIQLFDLLQ